MDIGERTRDDGRRTACGERQLVAGRRCRLRRDAPGENGSETGQSLVEFALVALLIMIILAGVLDLGRAYFAYVALQDAAGEGAAYGAVHPTRIDHTSVPGESADPNNIVYRVQNSSTNSNIISLQDTIVEVEVPNIEPPNPITVTVSFTYTVMTPVIQAITGDSIILRARSVQLILTENN
jgi:Flp pilus assembly protein TadG